MKTIIYKIINSLMLLSFTILIIGCVFEKKATYKTVSDTLKDELSYYVNLSWDKPTKNSDGSNLNDLSGFKIYYGVQAGNYQETIDVGDIDNYRIENLKKGDYYFAIKAYNSAGYESGFSTEQYIKL